MYRLNEKLINNTQIFPLDSNLTIETYAVKIDDQLIIFDNIDMDIYSKLIRTDNINYLISTIEQHRLKKLLKLNILINEDNNLKSRKSKNKMFLKFKFLNQNILIKLCKPLIFLLNKPLLLFISIYIFLTFIYIIINYNNIYKHFINADFLPPILLIPLSYVSVFFHELGHCTALIKNNQKPKGIGIGLYYYLPVFYSDLTFAWFLKRRERILVNISGFIFQIYIYIFFNLLIFLFFKKYLIHYFAYLTLIYVNVIINFNPFLKFDGYWIVSDLLGIPNLNHTIKVLNKYLFKDIINSIKLRKICFLYTNSFMKIIKKNVRLVFIIYLIFTDIFYFWFYFNIFYKIIPLNIIYIKDIIIYFVDLIIQRKLYFGKEIFYKCVSILFLVMIIRYCIYNLINLIKKIFIKKNKRIYYE